MTVGLEDYWSRAIGQVVTRLVVRKGAITYTNIGGSSRSKEGETTTSYDGLVQTLERDFAVVIASGVKVVVVNEMRVE